MVEPAGMPEPMAGWALAASQTPSPVTAVATAQRGSRVPPSEERMASSPEDAEISQKAAQASPNTWRSSSSKRISSPATETKHSPPAMVAMARVTGRDPNPGTVGIWRAVTHTRKARARGTRHSPTMRTKAWPGARPRSSPRSPRTVQAAETA